MLGVADNADDRSWRPVIFQIDLLTNRIFIGPELHRHGLIDEIYGRALEVIRFVKRPSAHQWNAHRCEIICGYRIEENSRLLAAFGTLTIGQGNESPSAVSGE